MIGRDMRERSILPGARGGAEREEVRLGQVQGMASGRFAATIKARVGRGISSRRPGTMRNGWRLGRETIFEIGSGSESESGGKARLNGIGTEVEEVILSAPGT